MSKRPCGHDSEQSDSVYTCFPCEEVREKDAADAIWNAALEAAALEATQKVEGWRSYVMSGPDYSYLRHMADEAEDLAKRLRAMKRTP